ncbi:MAG: sulfatase [Candidatus Omnitrophota bacterium]|nr:sulfatase [Candidatus Omnitrophota bacterium]
MRLNKSYAIIAVIIVFVSLIYFFFNFGYSKAVQKYNVLFITIDALRPDHLSCYGYKRNTSPNIDKLSREGVIFTQAISASSSTISSVPSIMTSTYPDVHGIWEFGNFLDSSIVTLESVLKKNNFYTGIISAQLYPHLISRGDFFSKKLKLDAKADEITDWAIDWLGKNKNKKFFLWLHYFDPHGPYTPPSPYDEMYIKDRFYEKGIEIPLLNKERGGFGGIPGYQAQDGNKDKNYYIAKYDGEIRFTDNQIGRLINALKETGLLHKTIIIITSDHGESLGEHNYYFDHGAYLYDNLIKVPLIIYFNSFVPLNKTINQQVSLIDIMPTILDIAKVRLHRQAKFEGVNLVPLISKREVRRNPYVFSEYFEGGSQKFAIRGNGWKLLYGKKNGDYELYNLKDDPGELNNLFFLEKEKSEDLMRMLDIFLKRPVRKTKRTKIELNEEDKEKLKSLGYLSPK